jgi:hypothetical protein
MRSGLPVASIAPFGLLRHVAPRISGTDHTAYHALKGLENRWAYSFIIENNDALNTINTIDGTFDIDITEISRLQRGGPLLVNILSGDLRQENLGAENIQVFSLDTRGFLLLDNYGSENPFLTIPVTLFTEYETLDTNMARLLREARDLGLYEQTPSHQRPDIILDFLELEAQALLTDPCEETRASWLNLRESYLLSIENFLSSPIEAALISGYNELLTDDSLSEDDIYEILAMIDSSASFFSSMREEFAKLTHTRDFLAAHVEGSFCIMGPLNESAASFSSALLANALITGSHIRPSSFFHQLENMSFSFFPHGAAWPLTTPLIAVFCLSVLKPLAAFLGTVFFTLAIAAVFSFSFVMTGYWIDPLVPSFACLFGGFVLWTFKSLEALKSKIRFRDAYSPSLNKEMLQTLIKKGEDAFKDVASSNAVIIAVKKPGLLSLEDSWSSFEAKRGSCFQTTSMRYF